MAAATPSREGTTNSDKATQIMEYGIEGCWMRFSRPFRNYKTYIKYILIKQTESQIMRWFLLL